MCNILYDEHSSVKQSSANIYPNIASFFHWSRKYSKRKITHIFLSTIKDLRTKRKIHLFDLLVVSYIFNEFVVQIEEDTLNLEKFHDKNIYPEVGRCIFHDFRRINQRILIKLKGKV